MAVRNSVCYDQHLPLQHACDEQCSGSQLVINRPFPPLRCEGIDHPFRWIAPPRPPILGMCPDISWFYPRPCSHNIESALLGRVGKHVPYVQVQSVIDILSPLALTLGNYSKARDVPLEAIYSKYSGMKRARYARAHARLRERDFLVTKRDARINMFVKMEAYKVSVDKPFPDCRAIQHRSYEYTLMLASKIKAIEHKMFELRDVPGFGGGRIFAKNLNQVDKAAVLREHYDCIGGQILCLDASRFDAHCQKAILQHVEHLCWNTASGDQELARLLTMQLTNKGSARYKDEVLTYTVEGGRMSGDANTSGGNCIIMGSMLAAFGAFIKRKFGFTCDGDDSVFFHSGDPIPDPVIEEFFLQFGFRMTVDARPATFEQIEFCQSNPVCVDGVWTMIRNPMKIVSKLGLTHKKDNDRTYVKRLLTTATCENYLAQGVPIIQDYTRSLINKLNPLLSRRQGKRSRYLKISEMGYRLGQELSEVVDLGDREISLKTRESFARAFGISVDGQRRAEEILSTWDWGLCRQNAGTMSEDWYLEGPYPEWCS